MEGHSLFDAVKILVEQTQLRQRLASLPREDFNDLEGELDTLLALAAEAETRGDTLFDFVEKMRLDFLLQRDVRRSTEDGIQLITAQKAKGSEWQAVILPFLGRGVIQPSPRYPCIIKIPGSSEPLVALTKDDFPDEVRSATRTAVEQEMARLLYVATTRARHTLVLALDEEIFARSNGEVQNSSQLKCLLGKKQINRPHFDILGAEPTACPKTARTGEQLDVGPAILTQPFPQMGRDEPRLAKNRAAAFTRKFNPSGYGEDTDGTPKNEMYEQASLITVARSTAETPATLYGRWWHDFMQRISWYEEPSWKQTFDEHQVTSPAPRRSEEEWGLFLQCLKNHPDFSEIVTRDELVAYQEMPFFWRMDAHRCLEGIVDLAFFDPSKKKWFILDWKTNRISQDRIDILRVHYRPQIAAYWKAIAELTGARIDAGIYSTSTGKFILYGQEELVAEWKRLRNLPPENFTEEFAPEPEELV
jgi:ATP-dependent exoDNAse (exonuclease V) beta subunit